jgi:uncharacterized protein YegL
MEKKHQVHNLIILDESGSMANITNTIISGFNELVQTIKGSEEQFPDQEHFISLISFNGMGQKELHFMDAAAQLQEIDAQRYQPNASTPLFDAMGYSLNKLKYALEGKTDYNVLVTIMTDGEENASKEFNGSTIKALVEQLKTQGWTFTYIGTDHDVTAIASRLGIENTMSFEKNEADIKNMFSKERESRRSYYHKIHQKENLDGKYFDDENKA